MLSPAQLGHDHAEAHLVFRSTQEFLRTSGFSTCSNYYIVATLAEPSCFRKTQCWTHVLLRFQETTRISLHDYKDLLKIRALMVIQKEYMIPSMLYDIHYWDKDSCFWLFITFWLLYSSINHLPAFFISSLCNRLLNSRHAAVQSSRYRGGEQPDLFCNLL